MAKLRFLIISNVLQNQHHMYLKNHMDRQGGAKAGTVICTLWNLILTKWEMINNTKTEILAPKPTLYFQHNPHSYGPLKNCPNIDKNTLIGGA